MSAATESFLDQLEAAATPVVIGTKKAAKALAPSDFKTSQQDRLADKGTYKRRQKKMEKGLLNQEVEVEEEDYPDSMKSFPMQLDPEDDDGEWITGDPELPIDWEFKNGSIKKADKQVKKDRATVNGALSELATLFQGITGQEPEPEEPKALEPISLPEPAPIVPYIDPRVIEEATNQLQTLFSDISGIELFGERLEEEEVIEIPVTPPETFDISEVSSTAHRIFGGHNSNVLDTTLYDPTNFKHTKVVQDVDALLEKHREALPEKEYKILKTDAAEKTADYLSSLDLDEVTARDSMPFTGANAPLVSSPMFATAVTGILRKMMATGPGTGVIELTKLDDVDATNISATHQFLAWDATQDKFIAAEGTTPIGDISGVIAGVGLSGGGDSGVVTLDVEASQTQITALGTITTGTWQGTAVANGYLGTGINANKLANGSVTNTEFKYINSLSSNAQTQLDSKPAKSFVTAMAIALG